jgi:hypothetical protein
MFSIQIQRVLLKSEVFGTDVLPFLESRFSVFPEFVETALPEHKNTFELDSCGGGVIPKDGQSLLHVSAIAPEINVNR